jgi:hypothetical protein
VQFVCWDAETRARHPQGGKDVFRKIALQRHAGGDFDDAAENVGGHPVFECGSGVKCQRQLRQLRDQFLVGLLIIHQFRLAVRPLHQGIPERPTREAGGMAHEVVQRHRAPRRFELQCALAVRLVGCFHADFEPLELGQVARHGVRQGERAAFEQPQCGRHRDGLGHGGNPKDGIGPQRPAAGAVGVTEHIEPRDPAVAHDQNRRAGDHAVRHFGAERIGEPLQAQRAESCRLRRAKRDAGITQKIMRFPHPVIMAGMDQESPPDNDSSSWRADQANSAPQLQHGLTHERRRRTERRHRIWWSVIYGSFNPRRRRPPRRDDEVRYHSLDWHSPHLMGVAIVILLLCVGDALLTLILLSGGAEEANPVMAPLVGGSVTVFTSLKMTITGLSVIFMVILARYRFMRVLRVELALYGVLMAYVTLIGYELWLLKVQSSVPTW